MANAAAGWPGSRNTRTRCLSRGLGLQERRGAGGEQAQGGPLALEYSHAVHMHGYLHFNKFKLN